MTKAGVVVQTICIIFVMILGFIYGPRIIRFITHKSIILIEYGPYDTFFGSNEIIKRVRYVYFLKDGTEIDTSSWKHRIFGGLLFIVCIIFLLTIIFLSLKIMVKRIFDIDIFIST